MEQKAGGGVVVDVELQRASWRSRPAACEMGEFGLV